ncbi:MAG: type II secretion system minor pseudopilin GspK [Pseudomonadota bacterium]
MRYRRTEISAAVHRQRGAALVVAMLIFALCASLVVAMQSEFTRFFQRSANILQQEQVSAYLRLGEELAKTVLMRDYDQDQLANRYRDDLTEEWAQNAPPQLLDNAELRGFLSDLQGRFNLNRLGERPEAQPGERKFTSAQAQFIRLLQTFQEPRVSDFEAIAITDAVGDWIDSDRSPFRDGAEDDYYAGLSPSYRAPHRPMASVSELRAVKGMTPQLFEALRPFVTVWPQEPAPLNIHTAELPVLRSIGDLEDLAPLSLSDGEQLVEYRNSVGFVDMEDFYAQGPLADRPEVRTAMSGLLGERSDYFLVTVQVTVADRVQRLYSVLDRKQRRVNTIARVSGSL